MGNVLFTPSLDDKLILQQNEQELDSIENCENMDADLNDCDQFTNLSPTLSSVSPSLKGNFQGVCTTNKKSECDYFCVIQPVVSLESNYKNDSSCGITDKKDEQIKLDEQSEDFIENKLDIKNESPEVLQLKCSQHNDDASHPEKTFESDEETPIEIDTYEASSQPSSQPTPQSLSSQTDIKKHESSESGCSKNGPDSETECCSTSSKWPKVLLEQLNFDDIMSAEAPVQQKLSPIWPKVVLSPCGDGWYH